MLPSEQLHRAGGCKVSEVELLLLWAGRTPALGTFAQALTWPCRVLRRRGGPEASKADHTGPCETQRRVWVSFYTSWKAFDDLNRWCWIWLVVWKDDHDFQVERGGKELGVELSTPVESHARARWHRRTAWRGWWDGGEASWRWCQQNWRREDVEDEGQRRSPHDFWLPAWETGWMLKAPLITASAIPWWF